MRRVLGTAVAILVVAVIVVSGQAEKTVWDGVYTEEQAKRGADVYAEKCAGCHGDSKPTQQTPGRVFCTANETAAFPAIPADCPVQPDVVIPPPEGT